MLESNLLKKIAHNSNVGFWEIKDDVHYWSQSFIDVLGFNSQNITANTEYFITNLLHNDFKTSFKDSYTAFIEKNIDFELPIKIITKAGNYKEFICKTNEKLPVNIDKNAKVLFFIEKPKKITNEFVEEDYFYYRESARMTSTGSWYIDFVEQKSHWDSETRHILEYPKDYQPSLKRSSDYYAAEHQELAANLFFKCAMAGEPFDTEIKMRTKSGRVFWAKAIGKPIHDEKGTVIGIRGVFQDIDEAKKKEIKLKKTYDIITSQNTRLVNFAHIVSHNLKSHAGNLSLLVEMIDDTDDDTEKLELLSNIKSVSKSLNSTVEHLKEVATIQTNKKLTRTTIRFQDTLDSVKQSIGHIIVTENAIINTDFQAETVEYIPAYLDSILLNLLTNAIKYKHKDRTPVITIKTYKTKDHFIYLEVEDNGSGIDMEKHGDKLFGMYKTFHLNTDAVGIGLFLTKNQIESLGGSITVESTVDVGSTFKIRF